MSKALNDQASTMLEEKILEKLSQNMKEDIDSRVLGDVYKSMGWIEITVKNCEHTAPQLKLWVKQNIKHAYHIHSRCVYLFESSEDAAWFALRWV